MILKKKSKHILLIEDESSIADSIMYVFESENFTVHWLNTGQKAIDWLSENKADFVILDVGLPDLSGFEVCKKIRLFSQIPILFLTARSDEIDRVLGLEIGADDYMLKPFSPRELTARVRAILRRIKPNQENLIDTQSKEPSPLCFDTNRKTVFYFDTELPLTPVEFQILQVLNQHPGWTYSREQLMQTIWDEPGMVNSRVIDAHIKSIRSKMHAVNSSLEAILTQRGFGYSLREHW